MSVDERTTNREKSLFIFNKGTLKLFAKVMGREAVPVNKIKFRNNVLLFVPSGINPVSS